MYDGKNWSITSGRFDTGSGPTVGTYSKTTVDPTVPSPIANFAMLTGGFAMPKYVFIIYGYGYWSAGIPDSFSWKSLTI